MESYEIGSTNVYADLGFADAEEMFVKSQLVAEISQIIKRKGYTQQEAAEVLRLTQPKLSKILRGHFHGFSERKLMDCLTRLGRDVQIVVRAKPKSRKRGLVSVVFA